MSHQLELLKYHYNHKTNTYTREKSLYHIIKSHRYIIREKTGVGKYKILASYSNLQLAITCLQSMKKITNKNNLYLLEYVTIDKNKKVINIEYSDKIFLKNILLILVLTLILIIFWYLFIL